MAVQNHLTIRFEDVALLNRTKGSLCVEIGGIKIDFLHHPYLLLKSTHETEPLRLVSLPDMAAMKINAVTNRGSKKDFSDLLILHENGIPLTQALDFFRQKYGREGRFLAIRSLNWFEDAETEPDPVYLNGWSWQYVKDTLAVLGKQLF